MYWSQLYSLVSATVLVATAVFALPQQQPPAHTPQLTLTNSAGTPPTPTPPPPPPPSPLTAPIAGNIPFPPPGSTAIQPMPLPNNCFILANSQECPAFNGLTINSNVKFTDSASFDNYLRTTSFSSNAALLQRFRTQHQCPTFSPDAQQYSQSMRCFNLVQQGQHACSPTRTAPRLVCRDVCIKHLDSLSRAFANPQLCDTSNISPAAEKARRDTVEKARNLCERMVGRSIGLDSPPSDCIPPLPFEQVQCGK